MMRNWNVRVILFCLLIQASLSFRHINILMEGQSKVNPARKSYSRADMFSSDSLYNNKLNPWSQDSRRNSFLANTAIISADTISMALLNSTIDVSDAKSSEYSWLDSLNSLSDISVLSERTNKAISAPNEDALLLVLSCLLTGALSTVSEGVITATRAEMQGPRQGPSTHRTVPAALSNLFVTALAVYLRSYCTNQLGMTSSLYFNQPFPLLLRLSGEDFTNVPRLQRLTALLGGAYLGRYLVDTYVNKRGRYRKVLGGLLSTLGPRGVFRVGKALWKWRKTLHWVSSMFWRRRSGNRKRTKNSFSSTSSAIGIEKKRLRKMMPQSLIL